MFWKYLLNRIGINLMFRLIKLPLQISSLVVQPFWKEMNWMQNYDVKFLRVLLKSVKWLQIMHLFQFPWAHLREITVVWSNFHQQFEEIRKDARKPYYNRGRCNAWLPWGTRKWKVLWSLAVLKVLSMISALCYNSTATVFRHLILTTCNWPF